MKGVVRAWDEIVNTTTTAILKNWYFEVNWFKFTEYYYNKLWNSWRKAPSLIANEVLEWAIKNWTVSLDPKGYNWYYKYIYEGWEMIYNPTTKMVSHLAPIK